MGKVFLKSEWYFDKFFYLYDEKIGFFFKLIFEYLFFKFLLC